MEKIKKLLREYEADKTESCNEKRYEAANQLIDSLKEFKLSTIQDLLIAMNYRIDELQVINTVSTTIESVLKIKNANQS